MDVEKHDLIHELPEYRERIHDLKVNNHHFAKLFEQYHDLDHEVRRYEQMDQPITDEHMEELKKKRLHLKDELYAMIKQD